MDNISLSRAQSEFDAAVRHRPRIKLTIRLRTRILKQWPRNEKAQPALETGWDKFFPPEEGSSLLVRTIRG
jgi:hypothetical protein